MKARSGTARDAEKADAGIRTVSTARKSAFEILRRVEDEGAFASVLLASVDSEVRSDDRALCYELVMGVLRWQLWLDALIEYYAGRKAESLDKPIRRALRMGLYELRFLSRIPASATVNETVNLAYHARLRSAAGLVNAVLRRASREPDFDPAARIVDPLEELSIATSHPTWLIKRWIKAFGRDKTEKFLRANNEAPHTAFRISSKSSDVETVLNALRKAGGSVVPSQLAPDAWRVDGAKLAVRDYARQGLIYLQDEASQLVAHMLNAQEGDLVLDVCAAPGSKTTHIAALAPSVELLVAGDLYEHRIRTIIDAQKLMDARHVDTLVYDAKVDLPFRDRSFDRVLVDAPCSGTGTLRHNPEIRWRISAQDISSLATRQKHILHNSSRVVREGGRLIYSTCSVEVEENEDVIAAFVADHSDFVQVVVDSGVKGRSASAAVRTWPQSDGADGFFVAAFERR